MKRKVSPLLLFPLIALITLLHIAWTPGLEKKHSPHLEKIIEAVEFVVESRMADFQTPGLTLALTTKDSLLFVGTYGYADLKRKQSVTQKTLFQIGSISKSFTALALMNLADRGIFDPDKPVNEYLPWFEVQTKFDPILVHHLLTHSAGIPANRDDFPGSPIQGYALREQVTAWAPGERFHYSNVGYQTLHALLEKLDGRPYGRIIEEEILIPLGMRHTRSVITLESREEQAVGYIFPFDDRPHDRSRTLIEAPHFEYGIGDGSIQSTAADMAAYVRMLLNGGLGPQGRLISAKSYERFTTPHILFSKERPDNGYGYGIRISTRKDHKVVGHSGGMVGFVALIQADIEAGLGVAVLANGPADLYAIARYAMDTYMAVMDGEEVPEPPKPRSNRFTDDITEFAGTFTSTGGQVVVFNTKGSTLFLQTDSEAIPLDQRGKDTFYTSSPGRDRYMVRFERNENKEIVEVFHGPNWYVNNVYEGPKTFSVPESWTAYEGAYRNYSPWFPFFEIFIRKGKLLARTGTGGESSVGETPLTEIAPGLFQAGKSPIPERVRFDTIVDGKALRAAWSGHLFYRVR